MQSLLTFSSTEAAHSAKISWSVRCFYYKLLVVVLPTPLLVVEFLWRRVSTALLYVGLPVVREETRMGTL